MKSHMETVAFVLSCVAYSMSIILNSLGIYILSNLKTSLTNQGIFLTNLSVSELLYSSITVCYYLTDKLSNKDESISRTILGKLSWLLYYIYLISPLLLTIDRLFCIISPWKYKAIFTKARALIMVLSIWICVILTVSPIFFIAATDYDTARKMYLPVVAIGVVFFVISFAIIAYTFIGLKIYRQGKLTGRTNSESKIIKVTVSIIVTYFIFEAVPYIIVKILLQCCHDVGQGYKRIIYAFGRFNTVSDPIIYLYNYPPLKAAMKEKLKVIITKPGRAQRGSHTLDQLKPSILSNFTHPPD